MKKVCLVRRSYLSRIISVIMACSADTVLFTVFYLKGTSRPKFIICCKVVVVVVVEEVTICA